MAADAELVRTDRRGPVGWITLNRPERLNAFAGTMRDDLADAVEGFGADAGVRVIVVTGAGRAFCAGADVDVMSRLVAERDVETFGGFVRAGMRAARAIHALRKPMIAAINGVAVGAGAAFATACDYRLAAEGASIGFTFNRIGLHPDWGASFFLPAVVGEARARELILSARIVRSDEAARLGLVDEVVPDDQMMDRVEELAAQLAGKAPLALGFAKATLACGRTEALEAALRAEEEAQITCFLSRDVAEGLAAFRERRDPVFTGD